MYLVLIVGAILIFVQSTLWESWCVCVCVCVCVCACVRACVCVNCKAFWASKKVSLLLLYFSPVSRSGCYWSGCIYIETVQCLLPRSIQPSETQRVPSDPTEKKRRVSINKQREITFFKFSGTQRPSKGKHCDKSSSITTKVCLHTSFHFSLPEVVFAWVCKGKLHSFNPPKK